MRECENKNDSYEIFKESSLIRVKNGSRKVRRRIAKIPKRWL